MEGFLDGIMDIFKASRGVAFSVRRAGELVIKLMVFDKAITEYGKCCGETGETVLRDYWGAKALAYGMAGRVNEGRAFLVKARERRTGGPFLEWCQTYYDHGSS
jgi:hypothetical protein